MSHLRTFPRTGRDLDALPSFLLFFVSSSFPPHFILDPHLPTTSSLCCPPRPRRPVHKVQAAGPELVSEPSDKLEKEHPSGLQAYYPPLLQSPQRGAPSGGSDRRPTCPPHLQLRTQLLPIPSESCRARAPPQASFPAPGGTVSPASLGGGGTQGLGS